MRTAEIVERNGSVLRVGEQVEIPVVVEAAAAGRRTPAKAGPAPAATASLATVRRTIEATAREYGVDPDLALAVSWQEAGWRMHHVSSADAVGAMQVIPGTGIWMSMYAGRRLRLHDVHDNVLAGVLLLRVLDNLTTTRRQQIAAYYQGLGAVRRDGLYPDTRRYVANVRAIKHRLERGLPPA